MINQRMALGMILACAGLFPGSDWAQHRPVAPTAHALTAFTPASAHAARQP